MTDHQIGRDFQEYIALGIVFLVTTALVFKLFKKLFKRVLAPLIAKALLKRGKIKWAMALQHFSSRSRKKR